ncbi:RNA methyltransferase [uncultured Adlercreutzia sp.]|uniref:TrmH family RNA methyltransferase n=2 Tax=uncultured Adlercreutzia sp. TaxID=875803 RepID=UPI0025D3953C|nr:RNA methyltransferase [uncultured Adlercreutzia sp.]MCI9262175.1 RNA methyltransferase [Eggerthellaceae bacterium]
MTPTTPSPQVARNHSAARAAAPWLAPFSTMTDGELRDPKQLLGLARALDAPAESLARGLFVAESINVIQRALDAGYEPFAVLTDERWLANSAALIDALRAANPSLPVAVVSTDEVRSITGYETTRGPLAAFHRKPEPPLADLLANAHRVAVLEDITNYTNLGAIFRSAAALGIDAVLLTPSCHDPLYRRAARVSMGTVFQVPWARISTTRTWAEEGLAQLRAAGFTTAAMALCDESLPLQDPRLKPIERLALVLGTEGDGLAPATIAACDYTVRIPMAHGVDSLNVAAASAVAFWELRWDPAH